MISPSVIQEYLNQSKRDLWDFKRADISDIKLRFEDAAGGWKSQAKQIPYAHQIVCELIGLRFKRVIYLLDMGTGKTRIVLDLCSILKHLGKGRPMLALVPSTAVVGGWVANAREHAPDLTVQGILGSRSEREEILTNEADVTVMTYAALRSFTTRKKAEGKRKARGKATEPDPKAILEMCQRYQFLSMDEMDLATSDQSNITFRILYQLSKRMERVYGMTGTPLGHDATALFSQFKSVDLGETFGDTIGLFRGAFFNAQDGYFGGTNYTVKKKHQKQLHAWQHNRSIRYELAECVDLPDFVRSRTEVILPSSTWKYYQKIKEAIESARKNQELVNQSYIEARYLCAGFMCITGEDGTQVDVMMGENPKLDALVEWLQKIPPDSKAVVFNIYQKSGAVIEERLKKEKIGMLRLYSKTPQKEKIVERFTNDQKIRVLVCSSAGAYGLNLQRANYMGFFESPSDPKQRNQMMARCYRSGQNKTVFCTDFVVKASVDVKILKYLEKGQDFVAALVDGRDMI